MTMTLLDSILKNWLYNDVKPVWAHRYLEALSGDDLRAKKIAVVGFLARIQVEESSGISLVKDASVGERRAVFEEIYKLFGGEESYKRKIGGESWTMAILEKKEELWRDLGAVRRKRLMFLWGGGVVAIGLVVGLSLVWSFMGGHSDTNVAQGGKGFLSSEGSVVSTSKNPRTSPAQSSGQEGSRSLAAVTTSQAAQQKPVTSSTSMVNGSTDPSPAKEGSPVQAVGVNFAANDRVASKAEAEQEGGLVVAEKPILANSSVATAVVPPAVVPSEGVSLTAPEGVVAAASTGKTDIQAPVLEGNAGDSQGISGQETAPTRSSDLGDVAKESKETSDSKDKVDVLGTQSGEEKPKVAVSVVENAGLPGGEEDRVSVKNEERPAGEMKESSSAGGAGESQKSSIGEKDTVGDGAATTGADSPKGGESLVGIVSDRAGLVATVGDDSKGTGGSGGVDGEGAMKVTETALRFVPLEPLRTEPLQGDLGK